MQNAQTQSRGRLTGAQKQIWLLATAAVASCLSLITHLASVMGWQIGASGFLTQHAYSVEVFFVTLCTLILLKLAVDEYQKTARLRDEALRKGVIREHQNVLKGQAKALDAHAMVSISSPTGQLLDANDNFRSFFGYGDVALDKVSNHQIYHGGRANTTHRLIAKAMEQGKTWQGKQSLKKLDGELVTVFSTVIPVRDERGKRTHNICIRTDITELERAEGSRLLSQLMGNLQEEVYVYEVDSLSMIYANKAACARCNWSQEDMPRLSISDSSAHFDTEAFLAHAQPLLNGDEETVTIKTMHEKGPVEISTRLVQAPSTKQVFVSVLRDISEQDRMEKARLESLSEASHELRSPLTSIKGSLRLLEAGVVCELPEKASELIAVARRNTDRLIGLVNDVLDYEKLKSGTLEMETCPTDLVGVIKDSAEVMGGFSKEHSVKIELDLPDDSALVTGNPDRLLQVVVNLISNAIKHSPEKDHITVEIQDLPESYRVSVKDNGPGVPEDARERIFESFGQANAADGVKRNGTGLGLAICQKILEMHGTEIELAPAGESGSEFYFHLPRLD